jgi:hypothetical protein
LERKRCPKTVTQWLGAACVLAVICVLPSAVGARTQGDGAATATSSAKHTSGTKNPTNSKAKSHPAAHYAATRHTSKTGAVAHRGKTTRASSRRNSKKKTARGQQKIDSERAEAIQEALIREHYMTGEPTGSWNQASEDAMRRYQADHGWQSKTVPDSRALISLGLGPSHDHLLNPESAMTTGPEVSHGPSVTSSSLSQSPDPHGADAGAHLSSSPAVPASSPASGSSDPQ